MRTATLQDFYLPQIYNACPKCSLSASKSQAFLQMMFLFPSWDLIDGGKRFVKALSSFNLSQILKLRSTVEKMATVNQFTYSALVYDSKDTSLMYFGKYVDSVGFGLHPVGGISHPDLSASAATPPCWKDACWNDVSFAEVSRISITSWEMVAMVISDFNKPRV